VRSFPPVKREEENPAFGQLGEQGIDLGEGHLACPLVVPVAMQRSARRIARSGRDGRPGERTAQFVSAIM
jgi:hypothetical protein